MNTTSVHDTLTAYLDGVAMSRSPNTARTYRNAVNAFSASLRDQGRDPEATDVRDVTENWIVDFVRYLAPYSPASERLYLTALTGWYEYLAAERRAEINLPRLRLLIRRRARRPGQRLPQFPRQDIEAILEYAKTLKAADDADERDWLRALRDRALLFTLADTGLRVHEAVGLRRGDIDWNEGRAILIGKGDREAVVRFSNRTLRYMKDYLDRRSTLDGVSGRPMSAMPMFARHDKGAGRRVLPISTTTARSIVHSRAREALGDRQSAVITPHSFRHYFVTTVLRGSGGNLKLAQELARHKSIAVTQRYAHLSDNELDRGYHEIFEDDSP
ncbi:MAG: tyrosine-type recombinase/integrase [Chloroflexi bacterium]|nr:tyrosine-type recombinase/integrase [Chloroflexota bacterium]